MYQSTVKLVLGAAILVSAVMLLVVCVVTAQFTVLGMFDYPGFSQEFNEHSWLTMIGIILGSGLSYSGTQLLRAYVNEEKVATKLQCVLCAALFVSSVTFHTTSKGHGFDLDTALFFFGLFTSLVMACAISSRHEREEQSWTSVPT